MVPVRAQLLPFTALLVAFLFAGCEKDPASPSNPSEPRGEAGSWAIHTPFAWTHDGKPLRGHYVTVYSDAAKEALKKQVAEIADERFGRILALFDFEDLTDLRYPPGSSTIDLYINRNHSDGVNWAYWGGFIFTIRSSDLSGRRYDYAVYTIRHELTHVFEFLIEGRGGLGTDVWFREGLAVHVGCLEVTGWQTIRDPNELESWISRHESEPGQGNPIKIHEISDFPEGADWHQYYRLFELAVTYLLDEDGLGRSYQDVLDLFYDVRHGASFPDCFQDRFGIGLDAFKDEFFSRVRAYLGQSH